MRKVHTHERSGLSAEASELGRECGAAESAGDGVSLNQWISSAVARKVGSVETAAAFFKQRAGGADGAAMMRFLVDAPEPAGGV